MSALTHYLHDNVVKFGWQANSLGSKGIKKVQLA